MSTQVPVPVVDRAALLARGHLPVLDSYRALAATAVVATHVGFQSGRTVEGLFGAMLSRLDIGVALFFALSGFLLFRTWAVAAENRTRPPRVRGYLWRRALRILPAYWLVVVVALTMLPANDGTSMRVWLASLLLIQVYLPDAVAHGLTQMWSLSTEVAFYLLLPLLAAGAARLSRLARSPLLAATVVAGLLLGGTVGWIWWVHSRPMPATVGYWLPSYLSWFAAGMLLAACVAHVAAGKRIPGALRPALALSDQPGVCWALAGGLFLVAATPVAGPRGFESSPSPGQALAKNLLYAVIVALVLLPATLGHQRGRFHAVLSASAARRLGDISYGIFLWHLVVLSTIWTVTGRPVFSGGFWPVFVETLLGTLVVAAISWTVLERPVMRLKSRVPV